MRPIAALAAVASTLVLMVLPLPTIASATPAFAFTRVAGSDRYDTARAVAQASFTTADTVVVATGANFPDALAASYLAGADNAPILLTTPHVPVPPSTLAGLQALKAEHVVLVGGLGAIGQDVQDALAQVTSTSASGGSLEVTRVGGATRYDTMAAVGETPPASHVGSVSGKPTAILASGANFPDALAAGPLAWARGLPIVLTDPNSLSPQAAQVLGALGVQQVLIAGGPNAVSPPVEQAVNADGITTLARFAGNDRSDTARLVAEFAIATLGFSDSHLEVATGAQQLGGADALAGAPHGGQDQAPVLVTTSSTDAGQAAAFAAAHSSALASGDALGGPQALPDSVLSVIATAAHGAPPGYDISFPQCASGVFPSAPAFGVVGVNGGKPLTPNPCLADEYKWATATSRAPQFYVNTADPGPDAPEWNTTTPKAGCDGTVDNVDCAYNYGYNAAADAFSAAQQQTGAAAGHMWWLDVETANTWSYGSATSQAANVADIQGAIDELTSQAGVTVGIYSTSYQWGRITGSPSDFASYPNWVPGAGDEAGAASYCSAAHSATGGAVVMTQYPLDGFDGDYLC